MPENPNAATARVDPDPEARPADVTWTSPLAAVGHLAGDESAKAAMRSGLRGSPQSLPPRRDYRQHRFRLRSGDWVSVRQLRPEDAPALAAAVERLSALSRYRRFHSALPRLTEQMVGYLTDIDHHDHEALVAVPQGSGGIIVGVARFIRDPAHPDTAEVAVAVADSWQRRGLGTLLLRRLARRASEAGIRTVTGDILAENYPTVKLARRLGVRSMDNHGTMVTTRMDIADWAADWAAVDGSDSRARLRALAAAELVLVPRLVQPMLDLSVELIRTLVVPVSHIAWPTTQLTHIDQAEASGIGVGRAGPPRCRSRRGGIPRSRALVASRGSPGAQGTEQ